MRSKMIKLKVSIIILLFASITLTAQKKELPKSENGFRIFHFGDSVEQYGKNACVWFPVENTDRYKYCGADTSLYFVNKIRFDNIVLCFNSKNRLIKISYGLYISNKTTVKEYHKKIETIKCAVLDYLNEQYGTCTKRESSDAMGPMVEWKWGNGKTAVSFHISGGKTTYWSSFGIHFQPSN